MRSGFLGLGVLQLLLILQFDTTYCNSPLSVDYVYTSRGECHFMNGTQRVRLLHRHFYNEEEFVYFDSDVGYFIAKTEFGRPSAEYWNKNKEYIEQKKAEVQTYCMPNYDIIHSVTADRRVKPTAKVSLMPHYEDSNTDLQLLVCNVYGYYPSKTEVKWYRNGQEEQLRFSLQSPFRMEIGHSRSW
uniref:HLA class II histocompatibility antigen, DRB1-15 beta chain n=1 Tax=Aquarana catesbeiana TaxID=8400 RepID=C1C3Y5_AQUCT|nr:HLA class II histocompatibility antigen, DRB1-15 beta chain precursor [Aquarana catesbeiana]